MNNIFHIMFMFIVYSCKKPAQLELCSYLIDVCRDLFCSQVTQLMLLQQRIAHCG